MVTKEQLSVTFDARQEIGGRLTRAQASPISDGITQW